MPTGDAAVPEDLSAGGRGDLDRLFSAVYEELHALARRQRRRWQGDHTLNTTALVHEAYVKLAERGRVGVENRTHFLALASRSMRHILCNHARARSAQKRGGGREPVSFDSARVHAAGGASVEDESEALVALDAALQRLEALDPRQSRVVECRFFGGLTVEETAEALGISPRTVKRDWQVAQAWLHREMAASG